MAKNDAEPYDSISEVFRYLVKDSGDTLAKISRETKIPLQTLYSLHDRVSRVANIRNLKKLADYFNVDLSIFCGLRSYSPPPKLTPEQQMLVDDYSRLSPDAQLMVLGYVKRLCANPENITRLIP